MLRCRCFNLRQTELTDGKIILLFNFFLFTLITIDACDEHPKCSSFLEIPGLSLSWLILANATRPKPFMSISHLVFARISRDLVARIKKVQSISKKKQTLFRLGSKASLTLHCWLNTVLHDVTLDCTWSADTWILLFFS